MTRFFFLLHLLALAGVAQSSIPEKRVVSAACEQACSELSTDFGSALHYPENDDFEFWDQKQQLAGPACRIEPENPDEVSKVLVIVVKNACPFAIKGGGHSREVNDSNSAGGVTIDMAKMRKTEVLADGSRVILGAGHDVESAVRGLAELNHTFVLGRVNSVGLGGFILGGGEGDLGSKYGLAMDNVFEYEIVLANGTITTAAEDNNPNLYWALRGGGGNNFGIVTQFTVRAIPETRIWAANTMFPDNQTAAVARELDRLEKASRHDFNLNFYTDYRYSPASDTFAFNIRQRYLEPVERPSVFDSLNEIPYLSFSGNITSSNVVSPVAAGARHIFASVSWFPSACMLQQAITIFKEEVQKVKHVPGLTAGMDSQPISLGALQSARQRGGNALGLPKRKPIMENLVTIAWNNAEDDELMYAFAENWIAKAEATSRAMGVFYPFRYMNHSFRSRQDVLGSYGRGNLARLRDVQRSVDPTGVFTSKGLCTGYWKLL